MRSWVKQRQTVYFVEREKAQDGIDTYYTYSVPIKKKVTVSTGSTTPEEMSVGINPDYDRYITDYDKSYTPTEGALVYVDVEPKLKADGSLMMNPNSTEPRATPDYIVKKIIAGKRSNIKRYGIRRRDVKALEW